MYKLSRLTKSTRDITQRIVLYARYSTDMQNPKSCDDQFRVIRQALDRLGIDHSQAEEIKDEGISGTDNDRPGYKRVLQLIKQRNVKLLAVDEQSRFTRNLDACSVIKNLEFGGGRFISTSEGIDTASASWALISAMRAAMNHDAIEATANRVRRGREGRVRDGLSAGDFPFGYRSVFVDPDPMKLLVQGKKPPKSIQICESEAETVRKTFQMFVEGYSIGAIARHHRAANLPSNNIKKDSDWKHCNVRGILRNPKYTGHWQYGKTTVIRDSQGKTRQVPTDPSKQVELFFPDRVIISDELWKAAQSRLRKNKEKWGYKQGQKSRAPLNHHRWEFPSSMFSCLIRCRCGAIMNNVGHRNKSTFVCPASKRDRTLCRMRTTIPTKTAERLVLDAVIKELETIDSWRSTVHDAMQKHLAELVRVTPNELKQLEQRLREVESKIDRLIKIMEEGGDFSASIKDRLQSLENDKKSIKQQIEEHQTLSHVSSSLPTLDWFNEQMKEQVELLQSSGPESWLVLRKLISPILAEPVIPVGKQRGFARLSFKFKSSDAFLALVPESISSVFEQCDFQGGKTIVIDAGRPTRVDELSPKIVEMRDAGLKWKEIARELGMRKGNLCTYYKRYKEAQQKRKEAEANLDGGSNNASDTFAETDPPSAIET